MTAEPYLVDSDMRVYCGDALEVLRGLSDESAQMCVTSPPYFGLRNYGADRQVGIEETPEQYVEKLVEIFREVRRVLRNDGVLWLNIGDTYNVGRDGGWPGGKGFLNEGRDLDAITQGRSGANVPGLKPKDLIGVPWMLAFALRADGWFLRSDCIWDKPNAMPESIKDRPTKAHEYLFLLSKSRHYFYDNEAIKEPAVVGEDMGILRSQKAANGQGPTTRESIDKRLETTPRRKGNPSMMRNVRSVWHIPTATYADAHYAVFPQEIPRRCIKAGSAEGDVVLDPFAGSGTVGLVARDLNRKSILIELNLEYVEQIAKRTQQLSLLAD